MNLPDALREALDAPPDRLLYTAIGELEPERWRQRDRARAMAAMGRWASTLGLGMCDCSENHRCTGCCNIDEIMEQVRTLEQEARRDPTS